MKANRAALGNGDVHGRGSEAEEIESGPCW